MLLYISVCLRTRQDTISYSFIYIIQKAEFQDIRIGNRGLESGESRGNIGLESGEQGTGNRRLESLRLCIFGPKGAIQIRYLTFFNLPRPTAATATTATA